MTKLQHNIPDFFIVGAPKCGTTALDYHLSQHPEVFMAEKEIHFFGKDIGMIQEEMSWEEYLSQFNEALPNQVKGESSVWYLYSKLAPNEILSMNPAAKIIILLRNPTEMIPSLHGQYIYNGIEDIKDFNKALEHDQNRATPYPCALFKERPKYMDVAKYHDHAKRYLDTFSSKQVLILLHDELKANFNDAYKQVLEFLEVVDTSFQPDLSQVNTRKKVKHVGLHQMSKTPPSSLKRVFRTVIPSKKLRHAIMSWVEDRNISDDSPTPIDQKYQELIVAETKEDTLKLAGLLHLDLNHWTKEC